MDAQLPSRHRAAGTRFFLDWRRGSANLDRYKRAGSPDVGLRRFRNLDPNEYAPDLRDIAARWLQRRPHHLPHESSRQHRRQYSSVTRSDRVVTKTLGKTAVPRTRAGQLRRQAKECGRPEVGRAQPAACPLRLADHSRFQSTKDCSCH